MIVAAGVVSLLVDFVQNQRRDRLAVSLLAYLLSWPPTVLRCPNVFSFHLQIVSRAIGFLDNLMYGYSSAFTFFCSAGGVASFVSRVKVCSPLSLSTCPRLTV